MSFTVADAGRAAAPPFAATRRTFVARNVAVEEISAPMQT
jgi:hypothetical protein